MFVDRTNSRIGQQFLYNKLRTIPCDKENPEHEKLITLFNNDIDFRLSVQRELLRLNGNEAFYVSTLFQDELLKPPKWYFIIRILSITNLVALILALFVSPIFFVSLGVFIINLIIHYWNKKNLYQYFSSIPELLTMNRVAKNLNKAEQLQSINPDIKSSIKIIDQVRTRMSYFNLEVKLQTDFQALFWAVLELVKIFFLLEPLLLFGALKQLDTKRKEIEMVFNFVGTIDAIVSITSLRKGLDKFCIPLITPEKIITAQQVYHPLIHNCISNSILVKSKSILLTGSNMSGKSSFIRTIGINVITGLTINTCFAEQFSMPRLRVFSAIRISDDLMNDKSYYFEEVLVIKDMIENSGNEKPNLFLLDEIFKGTNTIERISAGKAVLSSLTKGNNIVFVSTHDIELADLLIDEYELYHFSEIVENKTVDFDYKLKEGKLKNRNAIRILQINDYPFDIIREAMELSEELDKINDFKISI